MMLTFLRRMNRPAIAADHGALAALTNDLESVFAALSNPVDRPAFEWTATSSPVPGVPATGLRSRALRLSGGVAAGLAAFVLSAAGYAAVTGNNLADQMFANFGGTPDKQQGTYPIGVRQTNDGITVTVDHAVFDGSLVEEPSGPGGRTVEYVPLMVQITVSGLEDSVRYSVSESMMSRGLPLRRIGAVGLRGQSDILNRELPPGTEQMLIAYDTTGVVPASGSLALQLEVTVTPRGKDGYGDGDPVNPGLVTPSESPSGAPIRFTLHFSVPTK